MGLGEGVEVDIMGKLEKLVQIKRGGRVGHHRHT